MNNDLLKQITPDGMYVHAEREENRAGYRLHVYYEGTWRVVCVEREYVMDQSVREHLSTCIKLYQENDEFPRRCAAQRDLLMGLLESSVGRPYLLEFHQRMGWNPNYAVVEIPPEDQLRSVHVLRDMLKETLLTQKPVDIRMISAGPWEEIGPEDFAFGEEGNPVGLEGLYKDIYRRDEENYQKFMSGAEEDLKRAMEPACDCNQPKFGLPHCEWCPAHAK